MQPPALVTPTSLRAVLTGDLVRSQEQPTDAEALSTQIRAAFRRARHRFGDALPYPVDVFRGDSWQVYVPDPMFALEVAVLFRAALRVEASLDTRIALAIDRVGTVNERSVSESSGPVFRRSGRALDAMTDERRLRCLLPESAPPPYAIAADALADLADLLATQWTDAQAQAIALRLERTTDDRPPSQTDIASHWQPAPISQQAVSKHLRQAHGALLDTTLRRYGRLVERLADVPLVDD